MCCYDAISLFEVDVNPIVSVQADLLRMIGAFVSAVMSSNLRTHRRTGSS